MTYKGAELINLDRGHLSPGAVADIAILDPEEAWTVDRDTLKGKSTSSPWLGETLHGRACNHRSRQGRLQRLFLRQARRVNGIYGHHGGNLDSHSARLKRCSMGALPRCPRTTCRPARSKHPLARLPYLPLDFF